MAEIKRVYTCEESVKVWVNMSTETITLYIGSPYRTEYACKADGLKPWLDCGDTRDFQRYINEEISEYKKNYPDFKVAQRPLERWKYDGFKDTYTLKMI